MIVNLFDFSHNLAKNPANNFLAQFSVIEKPFQSDLVSEFRSQDQFSLCKYYEFQVQNAFYVFESDQTVDLRLELEFIGLFDYHE